MMLVLPQQRWCERTLCVRGCCSGYSR
jgi:hypothetical protein